MEFVSMSKRIIAARTLFAAIIIAAVAKLAGFDIGLDYALQFIMETEQ